VEQVDLEGNSTQVRNSTVLTATHAEDDSTAVSWRSGGANITDAPSLRALLEDLAALKVAECVDFRPSDDATTFQFLVPSNFFAVTSLRKAAEILNTVNKKSALAKECTTLADEVEKALKKYAVYNHPKYGKIYAFEVDGFGNQLLMDDANVPSLIALPYLGDVKVSDPIYQNTRKFVWSEDNPYFFKGTAGEGIGGPHIGYDMIWPMSIMMKAFTSQNDAEIKTCIKMLMDTDAGTGFMHESFHKNDPKNFTRAWFAWQNTLFGELILKLVNEGKVDLLNSIR